MVFSGEKNSNWKGGKSKCFDCKILLKYRYSYKKNPRCKKCWYIFMKGKNHPRWSGNSILGPNGKYFPKCINCNGATKDSHSILCRKCCKGALHPSWNGGISTLYSQIRGLPENRQFSKQVMYRDNYICQNCGYERGNKLEVHHIRSFAKIIKDNNIKTIEDAKKCDELWDNDNGITLCRECHKLTDNYARKI